mmetsp:Transcript_23038/g.36889  ORF Transcript_23038/g.36889 Transcript_23038/m.36889 type:complete len:210 (+) Transcript_23038:533-1162(+)
MRATAWGYVCMPTGHGTAACGLTIFTMAWANSNGPTNVTIPGASQLWRELAARPFLCTARDLWGIFSRAKNTGLAITFSTMAVTIRASTNLACTMVLARFSLPMAMSMRASGFTARFMVRASYGVGGRRTFKRGRRGRATLASTRTAVATARASCIFGMAGDLRGISTLARAKARVGMSFPTADKLLENGGSTEMRETPCPAISETRCC